LDSLISPNEQFLGWFGAAVSGIPDVNGDSRGDVIVGALSEESGGSPSDAGRAYIFELILSPHIDVTYGSTPVIDGVISPGEYTDADTLTFTTSGGTCVVYYKHNGNNAYFAFGVPNKDFESGVQVFVDTDYNDGTLPQTDDYRFTISRRSGANEYGENQGTGTSWGPWLPPSGWTGAHQDLASTWNAEFSLPYTKLGITAGVPKTIGISFFNVWTSTGDYHWPGDANWINPSTWGAASSSDNWMLLIPVPTLSEWGLIIMIVLLLATGVLVFKRRMSRKV